MRCTYALTYVMHMDVNLAVTCFAFFVINDLN